MVTVTHMGCPSSSGRKPHTLTLMALVPGSDARPAKKKGCSVKLYDFQHWPSSVENLVMKKNSKTHRWFSWKQFKSEGSLIRTLSVLDSLHLSFTLNLHSNKETPRVQYAVVVRTPECPPPVITPIRGNKYIWVLQWWQRIAHSTWEGGREIIHCTF